MPSRCQCHSIIVIVSVVVVACVFLHCVYFLLSREKCMQIFHDSSFYLSITKFYLSTSYSTCLQNSTCLFYLSRGILLVYSTCLQNSTCLFYLSLFVCLKAKKIDTELVSFSDRDKNRLIEPASPIFSEARATSREMSRDESAVFPDGADLAMHQRGSIHKSSSEAAHKYPWVQTQWTT